MLGTFEYSFDQMFNGLALQPIYVMIPIGYMLVYGKINFAHGEIFMIGAFRAHIAFLIDS